MALLLLERTNFPDRGSEIGTSRGLDVGKNDVDKAWLTLPVPMKPTAGRRGPRLTQAASPRLTLGVYCIA